MGLMHTGNNIKHLGPSDSAKKPEIQNAIELKIKGMQDTLRWETRSPNGVEHSTILENQEEC